MTTFKYLILVSNKYDKLIKLRFQRLKGNEAFEDTPRTDIIYLFIFLN